jgi:hypothetical protein
MNSEHWMVKFKICIITTAWRQRNNKHFLQIYFIFEKFSKFQTLFEKKQPKDFLKEGSKNADVNEGKFVYKYWLLFAL